MKENKKINIKIILTVIMVGTYLISNVITSKQIALPFGITMTGAFFTFPIIYVLSDLFSEVYGYKYSRFTCYLSFAMNLLMVVIFSLVIITPSPDYWQNQEAFKTVLGTTPRIVFASLTAYIIGDFVNDKIFQIMKRKHKDLKGFSLRAIFSSLMGEIVDCSIFLPLAFAGTMPLKNLIVMSLLQVLLKTGYEVVVLPITNILVKKLAKYEEE